MSEILLEEEEILEAADQRLVELGEIGGERIMNGKSDRVQAEQAQKILTLKEAYENAVELSDDNKEGILYALRELSDAFLVPAISATGKVVGIFIEEEEEETPVEVVGIFDSTFDSTFE